MAVRLWGSAIAFVAVALLAPALAGAKTADIIAPSDPENPTVDSGWQAGTCKEEPPESTDFCSVATEEQFFEKAAGHPKWGFTQFIVKHTTEQVGPVTLEKPVEEVATIRVDLPVGLSVNPGATEQCALATFESGAENCPPDSKVGESLVTTSLAGVVTPPTPPLTRVPVYNVVPVFGEAARFGLELAENEVFLRGDVAWDGDYHEGFTIDVPESLPSGLGGLVLKNRLVFNGTTGEGTTGDGTFLTTPSTCLGEAFPSGPSGHVYSTWLLADSWEEKKEEEAGEGYAFPQSAEPRFESPIPEGTEPRECDTIPYEPEIEVEPNTGATNSPSGAAVDLTVPHLLPDFIAEEGEQDSSNTRNAKVTLPQRMGINPSAANGLKVCTDEEFGKGTKNPVACPPESKVGTATIASPPLPEGGLEGNVYVGKQLSRDPTSGNEYRIFVEAKSDRYGISVRLIGNVSADPTTGRLTTTFPETPQVPFTSFKLTFDGGPRAVLSSPPTCGPNDATTVMTPWSGNPPATPGDGFTLTSAPSGGKCAKTMAERPFAPAFNSAPSSAKAGAFSPMSIHIARTDGQQELKGADITLAPGMTGKLAGIPYCPESALAAAAGKAGEAEKASSSCPAQSLVGSAVVQAGTGSQPLRIDGGKVFLSGPFHGAPLSLAVVTPATAGPFDLGTVVVRVALFVEPETAQIHAVSDPIPDVFGGTQLSVRSVDLNLDRPNFTLNPTSCDPLATTGALKGGGADPTNPAAFSSAPVSVPFQTTDCGALGFGPKLFTRLYGGRKTTKRSKFPKFRAVLMAREGDANIRRAALTLPHSMILEQAHIGTICTRVQLAANDCPARSIYGYARAKTPLLDDELAGPVYLTSSDHELPDLLADLRGQVNVRLRGVISSAKARIKTVFYPVPDVPVSKFVLTMKGGKKGLLVNSRDLCAHPNYSFMNFKAQNGKQLKKKKLPLRVPACGKTKHAKHRGR
ncbi:MAG TPA: hypothetical protein VGC49_09745 [Solirubrobacterales bacterium]|jgi:hypothetical protein